MVVTLSSMLVLHKAQFATASGLPMCAKWATTLDANASNAHFAFRLHLAAAVLAASSSITFNPIWAAYRLSGLGQT